MAFQPVTDAGQAVVRGTFVGGRHYVNAFGVDLNSIPDLTQGVADTIAGELATAYGELSATLQQDFTLDDVVVTDLRTEGAPEFVSVSGWPVATTDATQALPYQVSALISWQTALRGKSFRGRTYLGGFAEDMSNGNGIDNVLLEAMDDFIEDIIAAAPTFGVISRFHGVDGDGHPIPRAAGIFSAFTSGSHGTKWFTQRRRARV